ncbi:Ankyrin repeat-containing protein [Artemisia annua]|uniref:Ankyrin repeat-containing protein n=1 Tax=Artemisia annua TaxID=35608 RepID=A0A2U1NH31_ARTAN|nr:Ankyrin repeat-containing protein [Artemisia annua]
MESNDSGLLEQVLTGFYPKPDKSSKPEPVSTLMDTIEYNYDDQISQSGTPLHHAAKRGLEWTVKLFLLNRANALVMNFDDQTALDRARLRGYSNVVCAIEARKRKRLCFLHYTEDPADLSETIPVATTGQKEKKDICSSSCVICLDSPVEGAFIPCGHMAGCMSCLTEIESKKRGCPVCRTNIDQIIRLYAV